MDSTPRSSRLFVTRALPWLLAAAALVVYGATLGHWLTPLSAFPIVLSSGWDWSTAFGRPLVYLLGLAVNAVAGNQFPLAMNAVTALMAAYTVWCLARIVALLPHDRTTAQRSREPSDIGLLTIGLAWVPPVLAAMVMGLAMTFWEHATSFTGEMLHMALFAYCARALVEYRLDQSDSRLYRLAFVYGLATADNWGMIAYLPLFLLAIGWIRGLSLFRPSFLITTTLSGLLGLTLLFLMPFVMGATHRYSIGYGALLRSELLEYKGQLLATQRGHIALCALVMVLPLAVAGIRWKSSRVIAFEAKITAVLFHLAQIAWLAGGILMALDLKISPRQLVINPPLLPFYFCAAISVGYLAGFYLLMASRKPMQVAEDDSALLGIIGKVVSAAILAACVAVPVEFARRNLPTIRAENGPAVRNLADQLYAPLPPQSSLVFSDDPYLSILLEARAHAESPAGQHLFVDSNAARLEDYRKFLESRQSNAWPVLTTLAGAAQNVAGQWLKLEEDMAASNRMYYANPSPTFIWERLDLVPAGPIFAVRPAKYLIPPKLTAEAAASVEAYWKSVQPQVDDLEAGMAAGASNLFRIAAIWSRAANANGVELQKAGRYDTAMALFKTSLKLSPDNAAAEANKTVNAALAASKPIPADAPKPLERRGQILEDNGPVDEPNYLYQYGLVSMTDPDQLVRRAAIAFSRAAILAPSQKAYKMSFAEACLVLGDVVTATNVLETMSDQSPISSWPPDLRGEWLRVSAMGAVQTNDLPHAEQSLLEARKASPKNPRIHDALSFIYLFEGRMPEAIRAVNLWEQDAPNSLGAPLRLAAVLMRQRDYTNALAATERALKISASSEGARLNRAICNLMLNRLSEAEADYDMLLKKRDTYEVRFGLAEIAKRRNKPSDELENLDRYLEMAPKTTTEYTNAVKRVGELHKGK